MKDNQYFSLVLFILSAVISFGQEHPDDQSTSFLHSKQIDENDLPHSSLPLPLNVEKKIEILRTSSQQLESPSETLALFNYRIFTDFLQAVRFDLTDNRWISTICCSVICSLFFLVGLILHSTNAKQSRISKCEKEIRLQNQQLRERNDQMEFEYATLKRKHQKLLMEMDEVKSVSARDQDDVLHLRKTNAQLLDDVKAKHTHCDALQKDLHDKEESLEKHLNIVTLLNNEILEYQQELERERRTTMRLSNDDRSLKQCGKRHEFVPQFIQEKSVQTDQVETDNVQQLLETSDHNGHSSDSKMEEKLQRLKELHGLLNQERNRCRELETKLKMILELREQDAHLHIRQLGQTDAELRKARTDTERVRILQQQLELKQKQLDDVQKVLSSEQTKFSEECSKLQHETHEKWMEVKRLTRELENARKECEGLRRQITKYAQNDRSSQEKIVHEHEAETNASSSPRTRSHQQGESSISQTNESHITSPANTVRTNPYSSFLFNEKSISPLRPCFRPAPPLIFLNRFPMPFNAVQHMKGTDKYATFNKSRT